jgi:hypothetical protein
MWEILITKYRFYTYAAGIILVLFIIFIVIGINNQARVKDVALVNQLKEVSTGLERYYSNFRRYPEAEDLDLNRDIIISDSGFAAPEKEIYYRGEVTAGDATYSGNASSYEIRFKLRKKWPEVGVTKGKYCIIKNSFTISCGEKEEV